MKWYERSGPDANSVRDYARKNIKSFNVTIPRTRRVNQIMLVSYLDDILQKRIDGKAGDWGSYRSFATYGLSDKLKKQISQDIVEAMDKIRSILEVHRVVCEEVTEFGLTPPRMKTADESSKGLLTERGGGMFLEVARNW